MNALRDLKVRTQVCKICGNDAPLFGVVDFNKSCEDHKGGQLPLSGQAVYYRRCSSCEFLFTDFFDDWSNGDFSQHIYNSDYIKVDPEYLKDRPLRMADALRELFAHQKSTLTLLDYGGGNGVLADTLRKKNGFAIAKAYDPFVAKHATPPNRKFKLISCFETVEHTPDPFKTAKEMVSFLDDEAMILYSTLVQPQDIEKIGVAWWYVAPRNGHVSMHSAKSLAHMWNSLGLNAISFNENTHLAFRSLPKFAEHLIPEAYRQGLR